MEEESKCFCPLINGNCKGKECILYEKLEYKCLLMGAVFELKNISEELMKIE